MKDDKTTKKIWEARVPSGNSRERPKKTLNFNLASGKCNITWIEAINTNKDKKRWSECKQVLDYDFKKSKMVQKSCNKYIVLRI